MAAPCHALCSLHKIRPVLHHLGPRLQIKSVVVGRAHGVSRRVSELQFDMFVAYPCSCRMVEASPRKPCPVMRPL